MCIKSSNSKGDNLLVSCGNEDDPTVKFWDLKDQMSIGKWCRTQDSDKPPYYYLNVVWLDSDTPFERDLFQGGYDHLAEEDKVKRGFVVFVASIRGIDVYMKNANNSECEFFNEQSHEDIGSYLCPMTTIMHDLNTLTLLVGNVNGMVEQYTYKFDSQESEETSQEIDSKDNDMDESKGSQGDFKKTNEKRIKISSEVDIKALIERHRREGKFTMESEDQESVSQPPQDQESNSHPPEDQESNSHPPEHDIQAKNHLEENSQRLGDEEDNDENNEENHQMLKLPQQRDPEDNGKLTIGRDPEGIKDISGIHMLDDGKADSLDDKI